MLYHNLIILPGDAVGSILTIDPWYQTLDVVPEERTHFSRSLLLLRARYNNFKYNIGLYYIFRSGIELICIE